MKMKQFQSYSHKDFVKAVLSIYFVQEQFQGSSLLINGTAQKIQDSGQGGLPFLAIAQVIAIEQSQGQMAIDIAQKLSQTKYGIPDHIDVFQKMGCFVKVAECQDVLNKGNINENDLGVAFDQFAVYARVQEIQVCLAKGDPN